MERVFAMRRWLLGILSTTLLAVLGAGVQASTIPVFQGTGALIGVGVVGSLHGFDITDSGYYEATLVDFAIPDPISSISFSIMTPSNYIGQSAGPGTFGFQADPGRHFITVFGTPGPGGVGSYGFEIAAAAVGGSGAAPSALPAVPLPPAVLLFAGSLAALAAVGRRGRGESAPREMEASPDTSV